MQRFVELQVAAGDEGDAPTAAVGSEHAAVDMDADAAEDGATQEPIEPQAGGLESAEGAPQLPDATSGAADHEELPAHEPADHATDGLGSDDEDRPLASRMLAHMIVGLAAAPEGGSGDESQMSAAAALAGAASMDADVALVNAGTAYWPVRRRIATTDARGLHVRAPPLPTPLLTPGALLCPSRRRRRRANRGSGGARRSDTRRSWGWP